MCAPFDAGTIGISLEGAHTVIAEFIE